MSNPKADSQAQLIERLDKLNQFKIDLGLERLRKVHQRLNLHEYQPTVITVGGTNGKGSTVAALASLLKVQGIAFGAFTSPHIFKFNERININGVLANDAEILEAFARIDLAKEGIQLSYFEYAFLAALLIFQDHKVDHLLIEVGLGGRLDAANILDADVAIITTVDIDHTQWLGDDIESIAKEKAGIMRTDQPVVYGDLNIPKAIIQQAKEINARLLQADKDFFVEIKKNRMHYRFNKETFTDLPLPPLLGDWQCQNFAAAMTAVLSLGLDYTLDQVVNSLSLWEVQGRMQTIQEKPLVIADVAHNQQSVNHLAEWLKEHPVKGHTRAVFSVLADKNMAEWIEQMDAVVDHWFIFGLSGERALPINDLKIQMADHVSLFSVYDSGQESYQVALKNSKPEDRIIIFGSFHVLDEVLSSFNNL